MKKDNYSHQPEFVSLKQALSFAVRFLKPSDYAKLILRKALAEGQIKANAQTVLEEYACGEPRSFEKRRTKLQIDIHKSPPCGNIALSEKYLRCTEKGSKLGCNWQRSHLAWYAPKINRFSISKTTNIPRSYLSKRFVMYDVTVSRVDVEKVIGKIHAMHNAQSTSKLKFKREYRSLEAYRKNLNTLFEHAESGTLDATYSYSVRGGVKRLVGTVTHLMKGDITQSSAKWIARRLRGIDQASQSRNWQARNQIDRNLT